MSSTRVQVARLFVAASRSYSSLKPRAVSQLNRFLHENRPPSAVEVGTRGFSGDGSWRLQSNKQQISDGSRYSNSKVSESEVRSGSVISNEPAAVSPTLITVNLSTNITDSDSNAATYRNNTCHSSVSSHNDGSGPHTDEARGSGGAVVVGAAAIVALGLCYSQRSDDSDENPLHTLFPKLHAKAAKKNPDELQMSGLKLNHRERRFIKFASVEFHGQLYMTPQDFIESVTDSEPRQRLRRRQLTQGDLDRFYQHTPPLRKGTSRMFREIFEKGIMSYTEYLFLLSILTKPQTGFHIAFNMFDTDGNERVDKQEFLVLMELLTGAVHKSLVTWLHEYGKSSADPAKVLQARTVTQPVIQSLYSQHAEPVTGACLGVCLVMHEVYCGVCLVMSDVCWCVSSVVRCVLMCAGVCLVLPDVCWCVSGAARCVLVCVWCCQMCAGVCLVLPDVCCPIRWPTLICARCSRTNHSFSVADGREGTVLKCVQWLWLIQEAVYGASSSRSHVPARVVYCEIDVTFSVEFGYILESIFSTARRERLQRSDSAAAGPEGEAGGSDVLDDSLQKKHQVDTTLLVHFFGQKGKQDLKFEDFKMFMENLQTEVLEIEFNEFSKGLPTISELDFAKILLRYTHLQADQYEMYLERLIDKLSEEKGITFPEFKSFCQFLNTLEDFGIAMRMYTLAEQPISQEEFHRAVRICTGHSLSPHIVATVYNIFDDDGDGQLSYKEFIAIMKDRLHRGFKHNSRSEGWEAFKHCVKAEMKETK
ncbi:EF-hand domain [Trinorchestia longiramus]|nr:EF-hand domain [Trinorchestia longiramus]